MSRRTHAEGPDFTEALRAGIADLAGCEPEKIDLSLEGPGVHDLAGSFSLELKVTPAADRDNAKAPAASAPRQDRAPREETEATSDEITPAELDEEAEAAADFLEGLLDALDLPGDLRIRVKEQHAEVEIAEVGSGALIGRRGQTLEAIQELVRCAMQRQFERRSRVQIDVEGYRARRLEKLLEKAEEAIDAALDTGEPQRLEPMDVFERKAVHHLVAEVDGLASRSQGREPGRRIVIEPED
jgi:spoIIIJ-associated protein